MSAENAGDIDDLAVLHRLCDAAREIALRYFRLEALPTENKAATGFDPVTIADREIERAIRDLLAELRPEDGVLGEEYGREDGPSGRLWVLDPIDGTRAFMSGLLNWGALVALHDGERPVLGAMEQPYTRERFIGRVGGASPEARLERDGAARPLKTRACAGLAEATMFTTDPRLFAEPEERAAFERVCAEARLTRYGTDCYGYAMVAAGAADLVIESGLSAYDVQALIPIVQAAGGVMTDWRGGDAAWGGQVLAAGDPAIHAAALALLHGA